MKTGPSGPCLSPRAPEVKAGGSGVQGHPRQTQQTPGRKLPFPGKKAEAVWRGEVEQTKGREEEDESDLSSWRLCLMKLYNHLYRCRSPEAEERKLINKWALLPLREGEQSLHPRIQVCFSVCEKPDHLSAFWLTSSTEINLRDQEFLPGKEISLELILWKRGR